MQIGQLNAYNTRKNNKQYTFLSPPRHTVLKQLKRKKSSFLQEAKIWYCDFKSYDKMHQLN